MNIIPKGRYDDYPAWICADCGRKHGKRECGIATWHLDTCGICGEQKSCIEPRDFGHLKEWPIEEKNDSTTRSK